MMGNRQLVEHQQYFLRSG